MLHVFVKEYVTVEFLISRKWLRITWQGYITSEEYNHTIRELLRLTARHAAAAWLSDMRRTEGIRPQDIRWGEDRVRSHPDTRTLHKVAQVLSPTHHYYQPQPTPHTLSGTTFPPHFRVFTETEAAMAWLETPAPQTR